MKGGISLEGGVLLEGVALSWLGRARREVFPNIKKVLFHAVSGEWLDLDGWISTEGCRRARLGVGLPLHGRGAGGGHSSRQGQGCIRLGPDPRGRELPLDGDGVDVALGGQALEDAQGVGVLGPGPRRGEGEGAALHLRTMGTCVLGGLVLVFDGGGILLRDPVVMRGRVGRGVGAAGERIGSVGWSVGAPGRRIVGVGRGVGATRRRRAIGGDSVAGRARAVPRGRTGPRSMPTGRGIVRGHVVWLEEDREASAVLVVTCWW